MPSRADDAVAVCQAMMAAFAARDPERAIAFLDPQILLDVAFPFLPGEGATGTRRQTGTAVHAYLRDAAARTMSIRFTESSWDQTQTGTVIFQADGEMLLENGELYRNHYLFLFRARRGKIVHWHEYYNPVPAALAFGIPLESIPAADRDGNGRGSMSNGEERS